MIFGGTYLLIQPPMTYVMLQLILIISDFHHFLPPGINALSLFLLHLTGMLSLTASSNPGPEKFSSVILKICSYITIKTKVTAKTPSVWTETTTDASFNFKPPNLPWSCYPTSYTPCSIPWPLLSYWKITYPALSISPFIFHIAPYILSSLVASLLILHWIF